jgi:hypothetical protein
LVIGLLIALCVCVRAYVWARTHKVNEKYFSDFGIWFHTLKQWIVYTNMWNSHILDLWPFGILECLRKTAYLAYLMVLFHCLQMYCVILCKDSHELVCVLHRTEAVSSQCFIFHEWIGTTIKLCCSGDNGQ